MATNYLTDIFIEARTAKLKMRQSMNPVMHEKDVELGLSNGEQLPWIKQSEAIKEEMQMIRTNLVELKKAHATAIKNLAADFNGEGRADAEVEVVTSAINAQFARCQTAIKGINESKVDEGANSTHAAFRLNAVRQLAMELQDLSKDFRKAQKVFISRMTNQDKFADSLDNKGKNALQTVDIDQLDELENDVGFTERQQFEVDFNENLVRERDQQIIEIQRSVESLSTMMKELMTLVIDQGTMIDRIDYNVEMVKTHVEQGLEQLKKANKEHQSANLKTCIILLIVLIVMMVSVVFFKRVLGNRRSSNNNNDY